MVANTTCRSESLCGNQYHTHTRGRREGAGSTSLLLKLFVVFLWACPYKVPGLISTEVQLQQALGERDQIHWWGRKLNFSTHQRLGMGGLPMSFP